MNYSALRPLAKWTVYPICSETISQPLLFYSGEISVSSVDALDAEDEPTWQKDHQAIVKLFWSLFFFIYHKLINYWIEKCQQETISYFRTINGWQCEYLPMDVITLWTKDYQEIIDMFNLHTSHRDLKNRKQIISVSKLRLMMHSFDAFDVCNNDPNNIGMVKSVKIFGKYSGYCCTMYQ